MSSDVIVPSQVSLHSFAFSILQWDMYFHPFPPACGVFYCPLLGLAIPFLGRSFPCTPLSPVLLAFGAGPSYDFCLAF
jgi:hypothetical protein